MITRGSALFRQTLLVLVGALMLSHVVGFLALVLLPPGGGGSATFSGIARQLADPACEVITPSLERARRLDIFRDDQPPGMPAGLVSDPLFDSQLARALGVAEHSVRLAWSEGGRIRLDRPAEVTIDNRTARLEETIFVGQLLFARQWPDYWCVGEVPPPRWYSHWRVHIALVLLLSFVGLLVLAWWFARRLSRPIHDFATAADAIGRDEQAPLLEEKGPREMRVAASALNAMQARIQEQAREREAMIASIAHDLRTPLSRIAFRVEGASPEISASVQRDIEQMNAIITTTLEFAREGITPRGDQIVDLGHLLGAMVEDERAIGHDVRFTPAVDPVLVRGNDVQLNRLFQNLLDNARYFGGVAEVRLGRKDGYATVEISDQGPGIPSEHIDDMFRPFTRGEPSRNRETGGMGLGLSITRAIAQRHGGQIHLANREGGGLQVTVTLPEHRSG